MTIYRPIFIALSTAAVFSNPLLAQAADDSPRQGLSRVVRVAPALANAQEQAGVNFESIRVEGLDEVTQRALNGALAQDWFGRSLTMREVEKMVSTAATYVQANGYRNYTILSKTTAAKNYEFSLHRLPDAQQEEQVEALVHLKGFEFLGLTAISEETLQSLLADTIGQPVSLNKIAASAARVEQYLRNEGYEFAQAFLPEQKVTEGIVKIQIIEGRADVHNALIVNRNSNRVNTVVIEEIMAEAVSADRALNMPDLERALLLVSDQPGIQSARSRLAAGAVPGSTRVIVNIEEKTPYRADFALDSYGNKRIGTERLSVHVEGRSVWNKATFWEVDVVRSESSLGFQAGGNMPVTAAGLRWGAAMAYNDYEVLGIPFDVNGSSFNLNSYLSFPIKRSLDSNLYYVANLKYKKIKNDFRDPQVGNVRTEGSNQIWAFSNSFQGNYRDGFNGLVAASVTLTLGDKDQSDDNTGGSPASFTGQARDEGFFTKVNVSASRYQYFGKEKRISWVSKMAGQWTNELLYSAEKMQLGGPNGVRSYPSGEGLGDMGWTLALELHGTVRKTATSSWDLYGFYDVGGITQEVEPLPGASNNHYLLQGVGIGLAYESNDGIGLDIQVARAIGGNDGANIDPNTQAKSNFDGSESGETRFWLFGTIRFPAI